MFLEPFEQVVDRGKHLTAVSKPIDGGSEVLVLGSGAGHVREEELSWRSKSLDEINLFAKTKMEKMNNSATCFR